jgi:hypothetical protein
VYRRFRSKNVDKTPHINIYPEVMFRKRLFYQGRYSCCHFKRMSKSVQEAIGEKYPHVRGGGWRGGWKDFKSFFRVFL